MSRFFFSANDIFYLNLREVDEAIRNSDLEIRSKINKNKKYQEQFKNSRHPELIDSRGKILTLSTVKHTKLNAGEFIGTPVSPGVVKGPVKILTSLDEKSILPGDILVTKTANPGWTTYFLNAAGIILELGGTLQHGASIARESCKPCVVGIENICNILKNGQLVELDGNSGLVKIIKDD